MIRTRKSSAIIAYFGAYCLIIEEPLNDILAHSHGLEMAKSRSNPHGELLAIIDNVLPNIAGR